MAVKVELPQNCLSMESRNAGSEADASRQAAPKIRGPFACPADSNEPLHVVNAMNAESAASWQMNRFSLDEQIKAALQQVGTERNDARARTGPNPRQ